jgi:hypothetical protein
MPSAGDALLIQNAAPGSIIIKNTINRNNLGICFTILPSLFVFAHDGPRQMKARPSLFSNSKTA